MSEDLEHVTHSEKPSVTEDELCKELATQCPYTCPQCQKNVPFFITSNKKSIYAKCPRCGAVLMRKDLPREAVVLAPNAYKLIGKKDPREVIEMAYMESQQGCCDETEEEGELEEEMARIESSKQTMERAPEMREAEERKTRKRVITSSLFYRPKSPCEILADVLDEFAFINEDFKTFVLRRCERKGYLDPVELLILLQKMKSGVRTKDEAGIIAEEYAVELQRAKEEAMKMGYDYPLIFTYTPPRELSADPYVQKLLQIMRPAESYQGNPMYPSSMPPSGPTPRYVRQQYQPQQMPQYQMNQMNNPMMFAQVFASMLTPIVEMIKTQPQMLAQVQQQSQQQQMQMFQTIMQMMAQKREEKTSLKEVAEIVQAIVKPIIEEVKELKQELKNSKGGELSDKVLEIIKENAEVKAKLEAMQQTMQIKENYEKKFQEFMENIMKQVSEVVSKTSVQTGEFRTDEAKLVATALSQAAQVGHRLVDALDKRQPIKIIVEALPYLAGASLPKKVPKKYKEAETTATIIKELEEAGLVEE